MMLNFGASTISHIFVKCVVNVPGHEVITCYFPQIGTHLLGYYHFFVCTENQMCFFFASEKNNFGAKMVLIDLAPLCFGHRPTRNTRKKK